jgi:hypothetical protein
MSNTKQPSADKIIDRLNEQKAIASRAYVTGDRRTRRIAVEEVDALEAELARVLSSAPSPKE